MLLSDVPYQRYYTKTRGADGQLEGTQPRVCWVLWLINPAPRWLHAMPTLLVPYFDTLRLLAFPLLGEFELVWSDRPLLAKHKTERL